MRRLLSLFLLLGLFVLAGCHSLSSQGALLSGITDSQSDTAFLIVRRGKSIQRPASNAASTESGIMAQLPANATTEQMVLAFEVDYARAAQSAGVTADHNGLQYDYNDSTAIMDVDGLQLMIDPPSSYYRVWYVGYPESDSWMLQEAQLVLMAGDSTLTAAEAKGYIEDIFERAWNNRHNSPSAVMEKTPDGGITYSLSLNDRGLVSFWIVFNT